MENAVDALKIAAAVLIFIIAIATSFSLFGTAKHTADAIITMRDKQAYLEVAELDNGILYTSSSAILGDTTGLTDEEIENLKKQVSNIGGVTKNGDRIVNIDDIISTISRYNKEKYGVTIVEENGNVIVRYDSNTENIMTQYNNISQEELQKYEEKLEENTSTIYANPKFKDKLKTIYKIEGATAPCGAPWYGNDSEIQRRIIYDLNGGFYSYNGQKYRGVDLLELFRIYESNVIVEVTNEIDQSKYLQDKDDVGTIIDTNLLQQYKMPTIEIIYIIL